MSRPCFDEVKTRLHKLAQHNDTENYLPDLEEFILRNIDSFKNDYKNTSHDKRYSTGKLESELFLKLARLCNYKNRDENAKEASYIFQLLGYESYKEKPKRFRQKIENYKKKLKAKKAHQSNRKNKKRAFIKEKRLSVSSISENDESYSQSFSESDSISEKSSDEVVEPKQSPSSPSTSPSWTYPLTVLNSYSTEIFDTISPDSLSLDCPTTPILDRDCFGPIYMGSSDGLYNSDEELAFQEQYVEQHKIAFASIIPTAECFTTLFSDNTDAFPNNLF